jgi:Flp pilus assembly protein TadD
MRFTPSVRPHICFLAVLVAVISTGCGGARARYASHLERGKQYLAAGNLDKAGIEFRNALQIQPKDAEASYLEGRVAEQRRDLRQAAGLYQVAVDARPDYEQARAALGKVLVLGGAAQRALDTIAPALLAHPDDADLLAVRAAARHQLKDDMNARADAERAVHLAPANENAVAVLAALYGQAGDFPGAVSVVSSAVARAPNSVDLREVLASLYLTTGQPDQAEEQIRRLIELEPKDLTPRDQLATLLARRHKIDEAQHVLEQSVADFSHDKDLGKSDQAKLTLVDFLATQRSREQAQKTLRNFIVQQPDNLDLRIGLGTLLQRAGDAQQAVAAYAEVISRDGTGAKGLAARNRIAAIQMTAGKSGEAQKLIAEVLQHSPRDNDALIMRADIALQHKDPTAAISDLRAVLRDQPKSVSLQRMLARAYVAKNEPALAQEALRTALDSAPGDLATHVELARVKMMSNDLDGAVGEYEIAAKLAPSEPRVTAELAAVYEQQGRVDDAVARYEALLKTSPQLQQFAANNLAMLLVTHKTDKVSLDRALDLTASFATSDNSSFLDTNGWVRFKRREYQDAVAILQRAAEHSPDSNVIRYHLGMAQLQLGQRDRARTNLESALAGTASFSGSDEARVALASLKASTG